MPSKVRRPLLAEDLYLRAAALGRTAAGISGPNPPVGCVIVADGVVVGEGATAAAGGPHAEVLALAAAGSLAQGSTAVVTLEPCAHTGRTGPCTEALLAAGVAEVHIVLSDPDPRAAGGAARLGAAGIAVVDVSQQMPHLARQVRHDLRGFLTRVAEGRPHVLLKLAQRADGTTGPGLDGERYLTGLEARTRVHQLRADVDAVLVGSGTVRSDDPQLDVRHVRADRSPRPVVLATHAGIAPTSRVLERGALVIVGEQAEDARCAELGRAGATIARVAHAAAPHDASAARADGGLDLPAALSALLEHRILTVLAEPGPALAEALLTGGLVDEVELHVAAPEAPEDVVAALPQLGALLAAWRDGSSAVEVIVIGDDVVLRAGRDLLAEAVADTSADTIADTIAATEEAA